MRATYIGARKTSAFTSLFWLVLFAVHQVVGFVGWAALAALAIHPLLTHRSIAMIPLTSVQSTMIDGQGYDPATQTLALRFKGGKVYHYKDVPPETAQGLVQAESAGKYFGANIRGKYSSEAVGE
jgi:hypothetical protein